MRSNVDDNTGVVACSAPSIQESLEVSEGSWLICIRVAVVLCVFIDQHRNNTSCLLLQMGTIISLILAPLIIKEFSWPFVFFIFGSVGFVWLAFWGPQRRSAQQAANARFAANRALELPPVTGAALGASLGNGAQSNGTGLAEKSVVEGTSGALKEAKAKREEMLATVRSKVLPSCSTCT